MRNYPASDRRHCLRRKYRRLSCHCLIVSNLIYFKSIGVSDPSQRASVAIINPLTRLSSKESSTAGEKSIKVTQSTQTGDQERRQL